MANANDKEIAALQKFRDRIVDLDLDKYQQQDAYLLRWLRARELNVNKAEDMIRKHLIWRKISSIDRIFEWTAPEFIRKEFPFIVSGYDMDGCPIFIAKLGQWNVPKIVEMKAKGEYQRYIDQVMETALAFIKHQSRTKNVTQFIGIADLEGLTYRQFASKEIIELSLEAVKRVESNYPEYLKAGIGINCPKIFTVFYSILRPFFSEYTQSKIQLFGSRTDDWRNYLRQRVNADQLPSEYGGSNTTAKNYELKDGFETFQQKFDDEEFSQDDLITVHIDPGQKWQAEIDIKVPQTILSWAFKTTGFDIGFSILSKNNTDDKEKQLVLVRRADAHLNTQRGSLICETVGKYFLVFDNSYSRLRPKELQYCVSMKKPAQAT